MKKDRRWIIFIIIFFVHALGFRAIARAQEAPPIVHVSVSIEALNFRNNLPDLTQTVQKLEETIAMQCLEFFPFLRWQIFANEGLNIDAKAHCLKIVLAQEDAIPLPRIVLIFSGIIEGRIIKLPAISNILVYEPFNIDRPTHNSRVFYLQVLNVLKTKFSNESFRKLLHKYFLCSIPMSRRVVVAGIEHRIIIPIQWEILRLDVESVFEIDFVRRSSPGHEKGGNIRLTSVQKRRHDPNPGAVQGVIQHFDYAPIFIAKLGDWHDDIPQILSGDIGVKVFMKKYVEKPNPYTEDGLVISPD